MFNNIYWEVDENIYEKMTGWTSCKVSYEKSYFDKTKMLSIVRQSITEKRKVLIKMWRAIY